MSVFIGIAGHKSSMNITQGHTSEIRPEATRVIVSWGLMKTIVGKACHVDSLIGEWRWCVMLSLQLRKLSRNA